MTDTTLPLPIIVVGAGGRMGRLILDLAGRQPQRFVIAGAVDAPGSPVQGKPLCQWLPGVQSDVAVSAQVQDPPPGAVVIDFSVPASTMQHLPCYRNLGLPAVIGTTGLEPEQEKAIAEAAQDIATLFVPNTSRGVNVLFWLAEQAVKLLGPDYDLEVVEMHHRHKADSPSGTARRLAEVAASARGLDYSKHGVHGRQGVVGARKPDEIGIHAVRGGDVAGDHTLILAAPGERLELTHRASSRETFAHGALHCAAWLAGRKPGAYSMKDVLGLQ